jgi:transglutaminase-like putative cysteine protease
MNSIKEIVEKLTNGAKTDEDKMERIFYFVRDEIPFYLFILLIVIM